jgi:hypothetical protein
MSIFDDGFDMEDATIIGGIMGFAEESIREEEKRPDEVEEDYDISDVKTNDVTMKLLKNENPGLFAYVVKKVIEHKKLWAKAIQQKKEDMSEIEAVKHELEAMARLEEDDEV